MGDFSGMVGLAIKFYLFAFFFYATLFAGCVGSVVYWQRDVIRSAAIENVCKPIMKEKSDG